MADEPTRGGGDDATPAAPLTVAELIARSGGTAVGRRRAERRQSGEATGRPQPGGDDARSGRPPLRGGLRRDQAGPPAAPLLPTGWQPAIPAPQEDPPPLRPSAGPGRRAPEVPGERPARAGLPPVGAPLSVAPPPAAPAPASAPSPVVPAWSPSAVASPWAPSVPRGPAPSGPPAVPASTPRDPAPAAPAWTPARRVVPPAAVTPAVAPARPQNPPVSPAAPAWTPAAAPAVPVVPPARVLHPSPAPVVPERPALPQAPAVPQARMTPYQSVPVPGVRRSLPLPPIPGRDLPPPGAGDGPPPEPAPARAPMSPRRRRLLRIVAALAALVGLALSYYVGLYFYVDRSIDRVDALVTDGPEVLAPQLQESAETYLVVGTGLPGRTGVSAVSTLIAHVSAERDQAVLVTVPPTALTDTPTCLDSAGDVRPPVTEAFADALLDGGPSCLVRSVQQLTGLRVDHYLALDLDQLPGMVDALGDVPVCLPTAATGAGSELGLPAGDAQLSGDDVAAFLRPSGTGSDVTGAAAAEREQLVLTSTLRSALARDTLTDPLTLTRFLSRAGSALTADADTTLGDVRALGSTLGDLSGDAVERAEVPVQELGYVPAGSDQAAVVVDATGTRELFDAVIDGAALPAPAGAEAPTTAEADGGDPAAGTGAADQLPDPTLDEAVPVGTLVSVDPAGVAVDVLDATGTDRTTEVADALAAGGFQIGSRGVEPAAVDRTVVRYHHDDLEPARTVAAAVPGAVLEESDEVLGRVQLVIGPDYTGVTPVAIGTPVPTTAAPAPVDAEAGAASACS